MSDETNKAISWLIIILGVAFATYTQYTDMLAKAASHLNSLVGSEVWVSRDVEIALFFAFVVFVILFFLKRPYLGALYGLCTAAVALFFAWIK